MRAGRRPRAQPKLRRHAHCAVVAAADFERKSTGDVGCASGCSRRRPRHAGRLQTIHSHLLQQAHGVDGGASRTGFCCWRGRVPPTSARRLAAGTGSSPAPSAVGRRTASEQPDASRATRHNNRRTRARGRGDRGRPRGWHARTLRRAHPPRGRRANFCRARSATSTARAAAGGARPASTLVEADGGRRAACARFSRAGESSGALLIGRWTGEVVARLRRARERRGAGSRAGVARRDRNQWPSRSAENGAR